ncbi:MAG: hypothetical protein U9P10_13010 [Thermodesulfobacteriota bacterium]|nr:hypothetical protein [Thermodesulfobacteriota bacterium]
MTFTPKGCRLTLLKIGIGVGLNFNDKKAALGYEVTYNLTISCEENGEEKLCKLDYKTI